jgi:hypothetical protein
MREADLPSTAVQQPDEVRCALKLAKSSMIGKPFTQEDSVRNVCLANGPLLEEWHVNSLWKRLERQPGSDIEGILEILLVVVIGSFLHDPMDRVHTIVPFDEFSI